MPEDVIVTDAPDAVADKAAIDAAVTPAAQRPVVEPVSAAPKGQRPGIADIWAEEKAAGTGEGDVEEDAADPEAVKPDSPDADADADKPTASAEDLAKLEGKTEEDLAKLAAASAEDLDKIAAAPTDEAKAKADLDSLLATFDDPAVLNAALERAGVDKLAELPAVKALIGRLTQGVRDSTAAGIAKATAQAAQLAEVTAEGRAAKGKLVTALNKLAEDIENGVEEGLAIPTEDAIGQAFEDYAGAAVGEYHTKAWNVLGDTIYSTPEMGGPVPEGVKTQPPPFTQTQVDLLESVKGAPPDVWLAAHMAVERDQLWQWAQAEAAANGQGSFENDKVVIQAAHTKELNALTRTHEAALKTAREEARAEALADASSGKLPPKTPKGAKPTTVGSDGDDDGIPQGATISEIRRIVKSKTEAGVEV